MVNNDFIEDYFFHIIIHMDINSLEKRLAFLKKEFQNFHQLEEAPIEEKTRSTGWEITIDNWNTTNIMNIVEIELYTDSGLWSGAGVSITETPSPGTNKGKINDSWFDTSMQGTNDPNYKITILVEDWIELTKIKILLDEGASANWAVKEKRKNMVGKMLYVKKAGVLQTISSSGNSVVNSTGTFGAKRGQVFKATHDIITKGNEEFDFGGESWNWDTNTNRKSITCTGHSSSTNICIKYTQRLDNKGYVFIK